MHRLSMLHAACDAHRLSCTSTCSILDIHCSTVVPQMVTDLRSAANIFLRTLLLLRAEPTYVRCVLRAIHGKIRCQGYKRSPKCVVARQATHTFPLLSVAYAADGRRRRRALEAGAGQPMLASPFLPLLGRARARSSLGPAWLRRRAAREQVPRRRAGLSAAAACCCCCTAPSS